MCEVLSACEVLSVCEVLSTCEVLSACEVLSLCELLLLESFAPNMGPSTKDVRQMGRGRFGNFGRSRTEGVGVVCDNSDVRKC